jgi:hypothetical protein
MRQIVFGLIGCLSLAGLASGAAAQPLSEGQECRPPMASAAGYRDCRAHVVAGQQVCRCRVVPGLDLTRRSAIDEAAAALSPRIDGTQPLDRGAATALQVPSGAARSRDVIRA